MNGDVFCLDTYSNLLSTFSTMGASIAYKRCFVPCAMTWASVFQYWRGERAWWKDRGYESKANN